MYCIRYKGIENEYVTKEEAVIVLEQIADAEEEFLEYGKAKNQLLYERFVNVDAFL